MLRLHFNTYSNSGIFSQSCPPVSCPNIWFGAFWSEPMTQDLSEPMLAKGSPKCPVLRVCTHAPSCTPSCKHLWAHTHTSLIGPLRLWLFPSRWRSAPVDAHTQDFVKIEQLTRAAKEECQSKVHVHWRAAKYFTEDPSLSAPVLHPTTPATQTTSSLILRVNSSTLTSMSLKMSTLFKTTLTLGDAIAKSLYQHVLTHRKAREDTPKHFESEKWWVWTVWALRFEAPELPLVT